MEPTVEANVVDVQVVEAEVIDAPVVEAEVIDTLSDEVLVNETPGLRIHFDGEESLRKVCDPWDFETDGNGLALAKEMYNLMTKHNGIGLAAPQVGVNKRVVVSIFNDFSGYYFNPVIVSRSLEQVKLVNGEGCLSFPGLNLKVARSKAIQLEWQTETGEKRSQEFDGLPAVVFQHELDHLEGKLFVDYFGKVGKDMIKRKQQKIRKKVLNRIKSMYQ